MPRNEKIGETRAGRACPRTPTRGVRRPGLHHAPRISQRKNVGFLHFCLLFLAPMVLPNAAAGSDGSRRYAAYDYDQTTPQYTPDGRLLQVEYATNACNREDSNPIVSVGINIPGDTVLIMATISSPPPSSSLSQGPEEQVEQGVDSKTDSMVTDGNQRAQFRIIEVPLCASYHHSSSTILIGLSGILSDATSLLQIAYSHLEEEQSTFGWHRLGLSPVGVNAVDDNASGGAPRAHTSFSTKAQSIATQPSETVLRLSRAIADKCQSHAFGGGLRPFGASLLLAGVDTQQHTMETDHHDSPKDRSRTAMYETHPNGGWRGRVSSTKSNAESNSSEDNGSDPTLKDFPQIMVSGGPSRSQHKLKSSIDSRLRQLHQRPFGVASADGDDSNPPENDIVGSMSEISSDLSIKNGDESIALKRVLQEVISSLVEEWRDRGDPLSGHSPKSTELSGKHQIENMGSKQKTLPQMEVVFSSSRKGTFRLTESDVAQLMSQE